MKNIILYTIKIIVTYAMTLPFFYLIMVVPEESLGIFLLRFMYLVYLFIYLHFITGLVNILTKYLKVKLMLKIVYTVLIAYLYIYKISIMKKHNLL